MGHDELDVLILNTLSIDLLTIVLLFLLGLLVVTTLNSLAGLAVVVASVVVLGSGELLSSSSLGGGVQVLNLGLTEDATVTCISKEYSSRASDLVVAAYM